MKFSDGRWIELDFKGMVKHGVFPVRIGVLPETAPYDWLALRTISHMNRDGGWSGSRRPSSGADAQYWFGTFTPVPMEGWWTCKFTKMMLGRHRRASSGPLDDTGIRRWMLNAVTPKRHLRQVDFVFDGNKIRGLEQNPDTKSRWAQMARAGKKVMQFLSEGRYVANVVDGEVNVYDRRAEHGTT